MKKTIYRIFLMLIVAIMIFSFAGCEGNNGNGNESKSAYQIWLDEGNSGSEADFLEWLKGAAGQNGQNGLSAYQIWLNEGHSGSEADFLEWLKGESNSGLSAYELFIKHNPDYQGTEEEWLSDLANGKFARYTVNFESNGGTAVNAVTDLIKGSKVPKPATIYKPGYVFAGWFKERECLSSWNFNIDVVQMDMVLYAKWDVSSQPLVFTPIANTNNCNVSANFNLEGIYDMQTLVVPSSATIAGADYTVTTVASDGFSDLENLKTIILPDTVTTIEDFAFWGLTSLRTIYMPKVETIGSAIFAYCGKLENVFLPSSINSVTNYIFRYHNQGRQYPFNIHIESSEAEAASWIGNLGVTEGANVNIVFNSTYAVTGSDMLYSSLSSTECSARISSTVRNQIQKLYIPPVVMGKLVTTITDISNCTNLTEVVLPATVKVVAANAFSGCDKLESIHLSDVEQIHENALAFNPKLKNLLMPLTLTRVDDTILSVASQTRESDLTIYVENEYDTIQTLSWSQEWLNGSGSNTTVYYGWATPAVVTFESNGGSEIAQKSVIKSRKITEPYVYKDNYTFAGWFKDEQLSEQWDFDNDIVLEDITLYAAWTEGEAATEGLKYTLINGNAYKVSRGTAELVGRLVIPAEFDGLPVTTIDIRAFANISTLGLVSNITSVNLPDSITDLGVQSFYGTQLSNIRIPAGVTEIGSAFHACTNLNTIEVASDNQALYAKNNCVIRKSDNVLLFGCKSSIIPSTIKGIGDDAFMGSNITSLEIPYGVEFIGEGAFAQCGYLVSVIIPSSVTSIGEMAFWNCVRLQHVELPYGITRIEAQTFEACYSLRSIIIPNTVELIDWFAFSDTGFTSIVIPDSVTTIDTGAFDYCEKLVSIYIPDSVTNLECGFSGCTSLTSVRLPSGLTELPTNAFSHCTMLGTITLPEGLEVIGPSAFVDCTALKSVVIPASVNYIGNSAFSRCNQLETIYYGGANQAAWDEIEKSWLSESFQNTPIYYYSETEPATTGNYWHFDTDGITPIKW